MPPFSEIRKIGNEAKSANCDQSHIQKLRNERFRQVGCHNFAMVKSQSADKFTARPFVSVFSDIPLSWVRFSFRIAGRLLSILIYKTTGAQTDRATDEMRTHIGGGSEEVMYQG
jgi:hypothetical protein